MDDSRIDWLMVTTRSLIISERNCTTAKDMFAWHLKLATRDSFSGGPEGFLSAAALARDRGRRVWALGRGAAEAASLIGPV